MLLIKGDNRNLYMTNFITLYFTIMIYNGKISETDRLDLKLSLYVCHGFMYNVLTNDRITYLLTYLITTFQF